MNVIFQEINSINTLNINHFYSFDEIFYFPMASMFIICIFTVYMLAQINGSLHMYNTNLSNSDEDTECFYITNELRENKEITELSLIQYCKRHDYYQLTDNGDLCHGETKYTFEKLRSIGITGYDLYEWDAPIDTINNYEKFLLNNDQSLLHHHYCNCSSK